MARDPMEDPKLFVRIVEAGSLKRAAEEASTDPATVTRRLSGLEHRLGVTLLHRDRRGVALTEAGQLYYDRMRQMVPAMAAIEDEVSGVADVPTGHVKISCPLDFGARYVTLWLADLQKAHGGLEIELLLSDAFVDLAAENVDIAIRIGVLDDSALIARKLGEMPLGLFGSSDYLDRHGRPDTPGDLSDHRFVLYSWMRWGSTLTLHKGPETVSVPVSSRLSINNVGAIRNAVLAGTGLHAGPEWVFGSEVEANKLEKILPNWTLPNAPVHALYRDMPYLPARIRAIVDLLARRCRSVSGVV